ncbi:MAG: hypothetical protein IKL36_01815 [Clostridia bacterium]|nr:hypothetical protein [Clostridia bacterium]
MRKMNEKVGHLLMSVLVLFICVAATSVALTSRINGFLLDDSGAIPLIAEAEETTEPETTIETEAQTSAPETESTPAETKKPQAVQNANPGFEVGDDNTVWTTDTKIEIFKLSYENGEANITVQSSDGEKVFAPGTENSYTFKLKNTGNVALDYTVDIDAYVTPADKVIPVVARLSRYDGQWIVGEKENYVDIPALDKAEDSATLGAGKYTYYTLDWHWPFESGNDEYDTLLGDLAAEGEDISLTIVINTTAEADYTETGSPGITPPQTGDINHMELWLLMGGISAVLFVVMIVAQKSDERKKRAEANAVEKE